MSVLVRRIGYKPSVPNVFIVKLAIATLIRKFEWFQPVFECDPWYLALLLSRQNVLRNAVECGLFSDRAGINLYPLLRGIGKERKIRDLPQMSGARVPKGLLTALRSENFILEEIGQPYSVIVDSTKKTRSSWTMAQVQLFKLCG
jgi:hypothetical protein